MALYELLEARIEERKAEPVRLYDLLEARIKERRFSDELWRLLALRLKQCDERES